MPRPHPHAHRRRNQRVVFSTSLVVAHGDHCCCSSPLPVAGKARLRVMLAGDGIHLTESTIGRVLEKGIRLGHMCPCAGEPDASATGCNAMNKIAEMDLRTASS